MRWRLWEPLLPAGMERMLRRYTENVILSFDSDEAGQRAVLRAIPILKDAGLNVRVLDLKPYKDPDEFIKRIRERGSGRKDPESKQQFYVPGQSTGRGFTTRKIRNRRRSFSMRRRNCWRRLKNRWKERIISKLFPENITLGRKILRIWWNITAPEDMFLPGKMREIPRRGKRGRIPWHRRKLKRRSSRRNFCSHGW